MCEFKSGIIFKNRIVLAPMYNDSHSSLLESMNIYDSYLNASRMFVRAELIPKNNDKMSDISEWRFQVDQDIVPDWYEEDCEKYENEFREEVKKWMHGRFKVICGKLCVPIKKDSIGIYYMTVDNLFNSEFGATNDYTESYVREKLKTCIFAINLEKEYGDRLIPITTNLLSLDGMDDYGIVEGDILAIPTLDLYRECRKNIPNNNRWWLATPDSTPSCFGACDVQFVSHGGSVGYDFFDSVMGVRPFFILKS